jgi:hypothetical protein
MLLLAMKTETLLIIGIILLLQWFLAIFALYLLFKDKGIKKNIIPWNIFIMFGVIVGPVSYLIFRKINKNRV